MRSHCFFPTEESAENFFPVETTEAASGFAAAAGVAVSHPGLSRPCQCRADAQGCWSAAAAPAIARPPPEMSTIRLLVQSGVQKNHLNFFKKQIIVILSEAMDLAAEQEPVGNRAG